MTVRNEELIGQLMTDDADAPEPDAAENDPTDPTPEHQPTPADEPRAKEPRQLQFSVSLRGVIVAVLIAVLVGGVGVPTWLYIGAQRKLDAQAQLAADKTHAEKVALDYAVEAAAMNYQDLNEWKTKLVAGTSPELKDKLTKAATQMEQILVPLEWNSTARPLAAKVRSVTGRSYVVDAFVSVLTKTVQAPEPLQSTATYSVTIDSGQDWQITDVGGVGNALEPK